MCGIVAYSGDQASTIEAIINGLKRLEYRGYDSAGLAYHSGNHVQAIKAVGKVAELENAIRERKPHLTSSVAIGHTRWATHGPATERNAHPHTSADKKLWLVHNGIIENYQELKNELLGQGVNFDSDTDTEVVAKLIGTAYAGDLRQAVLKVIPCLKGAFSLAITHSDEPNRLIGVKYASPLIVGIADNEVIVASDVSAIVERTKQVIYLEDSELIDVKGSEYEIVSFENKVHSHKVAEIDWDVQTANKSGYDHYLLKEITEQPQVIKDSIRGRIVLEKADVKFGGLIDVTERLKTIKNIVLLGVGTSYYSAKLGEMYFNALTGIPTVAAISPEFRYAKYPITKDTWVIAMSQSGETADTIAAITEAKKQGALVTGVVNVVGSTIARITEAGIYNHIGPEISVASTKAFTSQSLILLMQAILLGRMNGLGFSEAEDILKAINRLPGAIWELLDNAKQIEKAAQYFDDCESLIYIGRQYNFPIAMEGALKIKELAYIHAEGLSAGELKHGFIALIDHNMPTIALATNDSLHEKMLANIAEVKARGGEVVAIANQEIMSADHTVIVPEIGNDYLQPLVNNVALQLIAYYAAKTRKLDVDQPRNLAKSVTVE